MAITTAMTNRFKQTLMIAEHDFTITTGHVFRVGLFDDTAGVSGTYNADTDVYTDITGGADEHPATGGYVLKGEQATNVTPVQDDANDTAFVDFSNDITYSASTISSSGAFIMNDTHANDVICSVHDFGIDRTSTGGDFIIQFPAAAAATAILRLA